MAVVAEVLALEALPAAADALAAAASRSVIISGFTSPTSPLTPWGPCGPCGPALTISTVLVDGLVVTVTVSVNGLPPA